MPSVLVAGVGMIPFTKPGRSDPYFAMGERAARMALEDAGIEYRRVEQAYVGFVYGDSTSGQAALYGAGMTGIPIVNVNNNCSTGSTALFLARQAVESGAVECALALGFEEMKPGALGIQFPDRKSPLFRTDERMTEVQEAGDGVPLAARYFGGAGREYQRKFGLSDRHFAMVSVKARQHASRNPLAVFRDEVTLEEVMESPAIFGPLTRLQCCPPTCGAAAVVVCSPAFAARAGIRQPIRIAAQAMATDRESTLEDGGMMRLAGYDMSRNAAASAYRQAGIGPEEVDVVELHDCFTANEIISYEALRLVPEGGAEKFIDDGDNTYGGRYVINPSGGLLSKGHPLGATGLAQCAELVWQLRGDAGKRQVEGARVGLQHNLGLGGACVVTLYSG